MIFSQYPETNFFKKYNYKLSLLSTSFLYPIKENLAALAYINSAPGLHRSFKYWEIAPGVSQL